METQELTVGRVGVVVEAKMLRDDVPSSFLLSVGNRRVWIPKLVCQYDSELEEVTIVEWYYDKLVGENKI